MKKLILIFLLAISYSTFAQTIRRCNNNLGVSGVNVYTTIQAAHDAAVVGDIVYVEPSIVSYGGLTCIKRLTIIGNGWADSYGNVTPNPPANPINSIIDFVNVNAGSQDSKFIGLTFTNQSFGRVSNFSFDRCRFIGGSFAIEILQNGTNITFTRCRMMSGGVIGSNSTGCTIQNCMSASTLCAGLLNAVITNNIGGFVSSINSSSITNNIFTLSSGQVVGGVSNTNSISNNICISSNGLPVGNGNVNGATLSSIFLATSPNVINSSDNDFQLAAASPAKGIGTGGTDAGAFGGPNPYVFSGLPPYPIITNFTTSGIGNTSVPLNVSVTVRGNN